MTTTPAPTAALPVKVGVIIPCYRSSASLRPLCERLTAELGRLDRPHELVFVDDASPNPETWQQLKRLGAAYPGTVRCFRLARNVGQHNALCCGIEMLSASVDIVITIDDDLQQSPEDLPQLLAAIDGGADLAIGAYQAKRHAAWRNFGGKFIDITLRRLFSLPRDFQLTSYRAFRRFAADEIVENRTRYAYLTASLLSVTRRRVNVPVSHLERQEGVSGYSMGRSVELALNLFLTYSRVPLYLVLGLFGFSIVATALITVWVLWRYFASVHVMPGWTGLMVMIGIGNSFNLAAMAIIALLTTRMHRQTVGSYNQWRIAERA